MKSLAESLTNSLTITGQGEIGSSVGTVLGRIGSGKPLMVSAALSELRPADTDHRLVVALQQCSGRLPALMTRLIMPNDGPAYSVVSEVRWDFPSDKLPEVVSLIEGAFKAAPADRIANELYRLRTMTAGRDQKDAADQEAENIIWLEQLRCYPGDIVIDVLRSWTKPENPSGKWWPTWNEIAARLERACDRRKALLNFVRSVAERPSQTLSIADQPPTAEQRARAADHWREKVRPEVQAWRDEIAKQVARETPEQALERLAAQKDVPVAVGGVMAKKIEEIKADAK